MTVIAHRPLFVPSLILLVSACASQSGSNPDPATASPSGRTIVTAEDIERAPNQPIEEVLQAHLPGVEVLRTPDGGLAIRIRGATSVMSGTEPLYIIDGVPAVTGPGGGLTGINLHEIASIEVLKDPASTAMYGSRGANGVVIIKSKR